jgi:hypothetical protein
LYIFFPIIGLRITSGQTENDIAASAATKSTLRVDDICGAAADDILTAFGLFIPAGWP